MLTVLVQFQLPASATLEEATAKFQSTAPRYLGLTELVRKFYLFDPETKKAGGCYIFHDRAGADKILDDEWRARVTEKYGSPPNITYFESPVSVDNEKGDGSPRQPAARRRVPLGWPRCRPVAETSAPPVTHRHYRNVPRTMRHRPSPTVCASGKQSCGAALARPDCCRPPWRNSDLI